MHATTPSKSDHIDRLLPLPEVLAQTGMSRATLYRKVSDGEFPSPVKIGRTSRWPASEIADFIEAKKAARKACATLAPPNLKAASEGDSSPFCKTVEAHQ